MAGESHTHAVTVCYGSRVSHSQAVTVCYGGLVSHSQATMVCLTEQDVTLHVTLVHRVCDDSENRVDSENLMSVRVRLGSSQKFS